jgi:hypothetical protein
MPPLIHPQLPAHRRIRQHEADRIGNLRRLNQPPELRVRQDVLRHVVLAHRLHHRRLGEAWVDDAAAHAVEHGFLHDRRSGTFEAGLGARVSDLPAVSLRRDRADEDHRALDAFAGDPTLQAVRSTVLGDAADHLQRPVHRRDQVDVDDELELFEWVDARFAGGFVDAHSEVVARDARGRHAQRHRAVARDRVVDLRAESFVGGVAVERVRERAAGFGIQRGRDLADGFAHVHQRDGLDAAARHRRGHRAADPAGAAGDDGHLLLELHQGSPSQ